MKHIIPVLLFLLALPFSSHAIEPASDLRKISFTEHKTVTGVKPSYKKTKTLLEQSLGRKLKFKEKIALRAYHLLPRYPKEYERRANNQAVTGFILSVCGIILFAPLLIPGLLISNSALTKERINPGILQNGNYGLAKAGSIIGIVGLIIFVIAIIIIVAVLSSGVYI